jgi:glycosidase
VGEVWDVIDSIVPYYPDQLDSYFTFEVADALVDAVRTGSGRNLLAALTHAQQAFPPGRWSPFLRNHDQPRLMHEVAGDVARARLAVTLLLTLPGFPFLYYGEELGMKADKPDPRLRTPMHWTLERAAGFTKGVPWEPLLPDSFTANVAAQHEDPGSLLNHHRRLIHLRASQPALAADAELRALAAGSDAVVAYLRTAGEGAVLVLANLGDDSATPVLASAGSVLPQGRYRTRPLLGSAAAGSLRVGRDGRVRGWQPVRALPAREAVVLELSPER